MIGRIGFALRRAPAARAAGRAALVLVALAAMPSAADEHGDAVADRPGVDAGAAKSCARAGSWLHPGSNQPLDPRTVIADLARRSVIMLGEHHDSAEDHRWQLHTLAALHGREPRMVIGFEMFPRSAQPVLDRWVAGELDEAAFLAASRWNDVWGFDPRFYMPLFHFARMHRIPMVALNVERALISRVARTGWAAIPEAEREGVSDPAPASDGYRRFLAAVQLSKSASHAGDDDDASAGGYEWTDEQVAELYGDAAFARFVDAQLVWDRAMAEALARARSDSGGSLVVGIIGRGHLQFGYGVPHQLGALGIDDTAVLLTFERASPCEPVVEPGIADMVFVTAPVAEPQRPSPKLGIMIDDGEDGVAVREVLAGSVAQAAGLESGDVIRGAAGRLLGSASELVAVVRRQSPGTWLPLDVERGPQRLEIVAKFPAAGDIE